MIVKNSTLHRRLSLLNASVCLDSRVRSYTDPELSSKTDIVLDIGNDHSKLKPGKHKLLFLFKTMLKNY